MLKAVGGGLDFAVTEFFVGARGRRKISASTTGLVVGVLTGKAGKEGGRKILWPRLPWIVKDGGKGRIERGIAGVCKLHRDLRRCVGFRKDCHLSPWCWFRRREFCAFRGRHGGFGRVNDADFIRKRSTLEY